MDLLMPMCEVQHTSRELSNQTKVEDTEGTHIRTRIQHEDTSHDEGHCEKTISQLSQKDQRSNTTIRTRIISRRFAHDHKRNRNIVGKQIQDGKQAVERKV